MGFFNFSSRNWDSLSLYSLWVSFEISKSHLQRCLHSGRGPFVWLLHQSWAMPIRFFHECLARRAFIFFAPMVNLPLLGSHRAEVWCPIF
jgi:hypothetical protein